MFTLKALMVHLVFYRKPKFIKKRNQNNRIYGDTTDMYLKFKKEKLT